MVRTKAVNVFLFVSLFVAVIIIQLLFTSKIHAAVFQHFTDANVQQQPKGGTKRAGEKWPRNVSPACHPHWKVLPPIDVNMSLSYDDQIVNHNRDGNTTSSHDNFRAYTTLLSDTAPISKIFFYHIRKAGGTMIRKYLKKVAAHYNIELEMLEHKNAAHLARNPNFEFLLGNDDGGNFKFDNLGPGDPGYYLEGGVFYITNLREPVSRSISHFKYEGRWDCRAMVKNSSYVPSLSNANPFPMWNETGGLQPSPCEKPFSFKMCAVNCYMQSFSGKGCTSSSWEEEYSFARDRILRFNMILVYEKFHDEAYVNAIENFFGVKGFGEHSIMFCGPEAKEANEKFPLRVGYESVLKLTNMNEKDVKLYKEVTDCWGEEGGRVEGNIDYGFPRLDPSRIVSIRQDNASQSE